MYKASEIAKAFEEIAPKETGLANDELGFVYGNPEIEVIGLTCLWNEERNCSINIASLYIAVIPTGMR